MGKALSESIHGGTNTQSRNSLRNWSDLTADAQMYVIAHQLAYMPSKRITWGRIIGYLLTMLIVFGFCGALWLNRLHLGMVFFPL